MTLIREDSVGETRWGMIDHGRIVEIGVRRWSDEGRRARLGETFCARIRKIDRPRRGAFLDLGLADEQGFLPLEGGQAAKLGLTEGEALTVRVTRESARGKSPVLALEARSGEGPPRKLPSPDPLHEACPASAKQREALDMAFEAALSSTAPIPGGGALTIEPTAALVAIDVDAAGRSGTSDPQRFALALNLAAAQEAPAQLRLRSLGGVIAIDFVSMTAAAARKQVEDAVRAALLRDPAGGRIAPISRFGVLELVRPQTRRPLHEAMRDEAETAALEALRLLQRAADSARGRALVAEVPPVAAHWLEGAHIDWRPALDRRIGTRWRIEIAARIHIRTE